MISITRQKRTFFAKPYKLSVLKNRASTNIIQRKMITAMVIFLDVRIFIDKIISL
jgi:hypothetical protein